MGIFEKKPQPLPNERFDDFVTRIEQSTDLIIERLKHEHKMETESLEKEHELAVKDFTFKIDHLESETIKSLRKELTEANSKIKVFEKEVEMMKSIVDLNADIVDVKDIINQLIDKLPTVNLDTINVESKSGKS